MRDFVIELNDIYVHVFNGPAYWVVEFDPDMMVSPIELLFVAEVLQQMYHDLEVQHAEAEKPVPEEGSPTLGGLRMEDI